MRDEDTWKIAHRILGFISFPMVLLYIACALTISDFERISDHAVNISQAAAELVLNEKA